MVEYCPFGEAQSFGDAVPQSEICLSAETAHDVGKVDGGEESEQVKDDNPLLPVAQPLPPPAEFYYISVFLRSERVEDLFIPLSFILSDVPVFDDGKTLYQKALRIVVAPGYIPQTAGGDKRPFGNAARTDDVLPAIGLHLVGITVEVPCMLSTVSVCEMFPRSSG